MATIFNDPRYQFSASARPTLTPDPIRPSPREITVNSLIERIPPVKRLRLSPEAEIKPLQHKILPFMAPYYNLEAINVADPEVTKTEFDRIVAIAESVRYEVYENESFDDCAKNIHKIFTLCNPGLRGKIFAGLITSGHPPPNEASYGIHGIDYNYHVLVLLKFQGTWHIIDPLMGLDIPDGALNIIDDDRFDQIKNQPIAMKAIDWMLAAFDGSEMQTREASSLSERKLELQRMRVMGEHNTAAFAVGADDDSNDFSSSEQFPTKLREPGTGKNMLNLSDMIRLFRGEVSLGKLSMMSEDKTPSQIAEEVDLDVVSSTFKISFPIIDPLAYERPPPEERYVRSLGKLDLIAEKRRRKLGNETLPFMHKGEADPTVSEIQFKRVVEIAEHVKSVMPQTEPFDLCCEKINAIFEHCEQLSHTLKDKIFGAIITFGEEPHKQELYPVYGIYFEYHCVLLLKTEKGWHVIDPISGVEASDEEEDKLREEIFRNQPVATEAKDWILKAFDVETVKKKLAQNKTDLYRMRLLARDNMADFENGELFKTDFDNPADYRTQEIWPLKLTEPESGKNMLNLSDMIKLFNGQATLGELLKRSESKTPLQIAKEIDVKVVASTFKIPHP